jgi:hypothetical protein
MIRMHRMFGITGLFVGLALSLLVVLPVQAANLNIDDTVEGQISMTHDANWEFGVISNGTPFAGFVSGTTTVPGESASFSGTWFVNSGGNPDPGTGVIYIVDPGNPNLVRATITASWSTIVQPGFDIATISIAVQSSASGGNLGALPAAFAGLGVTEPNGFIGIQGSFRDPVTAAVVSIPSNLTIQYGAAPNADCDGDGVANSVDVCPGTVLPEQNVPSIGLGTNRFADTDGDGVFDTTAPKGKGPQKSFTIQDTAGCSCEQIIVEQGLGEGHEKYGCSISAMEDWINLVTP